MGQRFLGIEFGARAVRVLELDSGARGAFEVTRYIDEPVQWRGDRTQAYAEALQRVAAQVSLVAEGVAVSLPTGEALSTRLELPFDDPKLVAQVLPMKLVGQLPVSDAHEVAFSMVGASEGGHEALVVAYLVATLRERLALLDEVDCDPHVMAPLVYTEHLAAALLRSEVSEAWALVDLGAEHAHCTVMRGGAWAMSRSVLAGGQALTEALADALGVDARAAEDLKLARGFVAPAGAERAWAEELGVEPAHVDAQPVDLAVLARAMRDGLRPLVFGLRQTLLAFSSRTRVPVERLELTGGGAELPGLIPYLAAELGLEVRRFAPDHPLLHKSEASADPSAIGPLSLALAATQQAGSPLAINLRVGRVAYKGGLDFLRDHAASLIAIAAALLLSFVFLLAARFYALDVEREQVDAALTATSHELFDAPVQSADDVDARLAEVQGFDLMPQRSAYYHLAALTFMLEEGFLNEPGRLFEFRQLKIDPKPPKVSIDGVADSVETFALIKQSLSRYRCFPPQIENKQLNDQGDRVTFQLSFSADCRVNADL